MAEKKSKAKAKGIKSWLPMLVALLTGGGVGGWQLSDHPALQKALHFLAVQTGASDEVKEAIAKGEVPTKVVGEVLTQVAETATAPTKPGVYEVKIDKLKLDPSFLPSGRTVDLQVRVRKIQADGKEGTVWESDSYGERLAQVGRDPLTASWSERPFRVAWQPGEQFLVEIWNKRGLRDTRLFVMSEPDGKGAFPMRSGSHALELVARDLKPTDRPEGNSLELSATRVGDVPGSTASSTASRPVDGQRRR